MLVDLSAVAFDVPGLGGAGCDLEFVAGHDGVGGVGCSGPFLAVGAVAEGCWRWEVRWWWNGM